MNEKKLKREIRILLFVVVAGLTLSGLTAFPIQTQLAYAADWIRYFEMDNTVANWLNVVYKGVQEVGEKYPFIAYGTDWLAYAHLILAILFAGVVKDPLRNIWVIEFGLIACVGIFPLAFIAGAVRNVPFFWQLLDCCFGVFGGVVLWLCYVRVRKLSKISASTGNAMPTHSL